MQLTLMRHLFHIAQHLPNNLNNSNNPDVDITIIKGESAPVWIFKEIYNKPIFAARYWENNPIYTPMIIL